MDDLARLPFKKETLSCIIFTVLYLLYNGYLIKFHVCVYLYMYMRALWKISVLLNV